MKKQTKLALTARIIFGLVVGVFVTGIALNISGDRLVLKEMKSPYDDFDKTVETITNRINQADSWHVPYGIIMKSYRRVDSRRSGK